MMIIIILAPPPANAILGADSLIGDAQQARTRPNCGQLLMTVEIPFAMYVIPIYWAQQFYHPHRFTKVS